MALEAIIFDLGGTLVTYKGPYDRWPDLESPGFTAAYDSLKDQGAAMPAFSGFRDAGFALLPERWQQAAAGMRNLRLVDLLAETLVTCQVEGITPSQVTEAAEAYQLAVKAQAEVMPAARETLEQVVSKGYKVGLVSNTMFTGQAHIDDLDRFGLTEFLDTMLFSADVNMWKPNPAPFLHVLRELKVDARSAVFIGDDPAVDVVGGHNVGMRTIHINSNRRFSANDHVQPDAQIDDLHQLDAIIAAWERG